MGLPLLGTALVAAALVASPPVESGVGAEEGSPLVAMVELHLPEGVDPQGLAGLVAVRRGQALSARAVRRSIERLWATGRFTDVVVRAGEAPEGGGLRVVFELTPVRTLSRLAVEGNVLLTDAEVREASGLVEGQPWDEDGRRAALERIGAAYRARGYHGTEVAVEETGGIVGVGVVLTLFEGAPTRVGEVRVAGRPGLPMPELLSVLGLQVGSVLDGQALEEGVERLRERLRLRRYYRARVGEPRVTREGEVARITVPLEAGPRFHFHFHGNHSFPDALLEGALDYRGVEPLDTAAAERLARRLLVFYRYQGFHWASVRPREVVHPSGTQAVLAFDVVEGHPLRVEEVRFEGAAEAFSPDTLRAALAEHVRGATPRPASELRLRDDPLSLEGRGGPSVQQPLPEPEPHTVFVEEAYLEAAAAMTEAYRERGYLRGEVRFARLLVDVERRRATAVFEVREGPRALVREVRLEGVPEGLPAQEWVGLEVGEPLASGALERGRLALEQGLRRAGYLFARSEAQVSVGAEGEGAQVLYRVTPGPQARVGQVIVRGLVRSREEVVRAHLDFAEGDVLDPEALYESQRSLVMAGLFRQVVVRLLAPEAAEPTKDVVVEVRERPRLAGDVAGGYFLVDGPRVVLDTVYSNLDGRGLNLSARAKANYVGLSAQVLQGTYSDNPDALEEVQGLRGFGGRVNLALTQPRLYALLPLQVGARVDLIGERVHRESYVSARLAAVAGLDWAVLSWMTLALQYELENNRLRPLDASRTPGTLGRADQERLRFPYGSFLLHSLRTSLTLDFRDDPVHPRRGVVLSSTAEVTRGLDVSPSRVETQGASFVLVPDEPYPVYSAKLWGALTAYAPLGGRVVLALSGRAGVIRPLEEGARTLPPKRFFLGGAASLRGFREDGVLPQERREVLGEEARACRGQALPIGCTPQARALLEGTELVSEGGEFFTLGKAELRFPALGALDVGLFLEAGNLWQAIPERLSPRDLRYVAGAGLRYVTPVGPLAFDVGVNLDRDRAVNEPAAQLHFSIGLF